MAPFLKKYGAVLVASVGGSIVLLAVFIANGSELEDAWLYMVGFAIVLTPLLDLYFKK
jgi:hypothetical protein